MLDHGDRSSAPKGQIGCIARVDARHMGKLYSVASVRVIEWLISEQAIDLGGAYPRIQEAGPDGL
jgi:hypothetical protein